MANTTSAANNRAVKFRGRAEVEMPAVSKAQNAAMHAAAAGRSTIGIPRKVGKEFVKATHGVKVKKLPKHVHSRLQRAHKRGLISDAALRKATGE